jgi:acetyl-CoA synthetase
VEDVLMEHPHVAEAAVVGYPHEVKGEAVYAFVIPKQVRIAKELSFLSPEYLDCES